MPTKIVMYANTDWYLYNFRRSLALALRRTGYEVLRLSPPGPYGEKLRQLNLRWEPLPMDRRGLNPLREFKLLWHLARLFARERPALVHSFTIKCAVYGSLAARFAGVPARINAVAGMGYVFISNELRARLLRPVVRVLLRGALGGKNARLAGSDQCARLPGSGNRRRGRPVGAGTRRNRPSGGDRALARRSGTGRAARRGRKKKALSEFDERVVIDRTIEVYRELLAT